MQVIWQQRVEEVAQERLAGNIFAAFNTNVDVVVHLTEENVQGLSNDPQVCLSTVRELNAEEIWEVETENDFVAVIRDALGQGKSFYVILNNMDLLDWLEEKFPVRNESMGGQAGIIANQMAALGANSIVYTSLLSPKQGSMFFPQVKVPVVSDKLQVKNVMDSVRTQDHTKVNWIFEYGKGEQFEIDGQVIRTPRANRVILATRPEGVVMGFSEEMRDHLPELGQQLDVAFMAGFHYAPTQVDELQSYLEYSMNCIRRLKENNKKLRFHFEYVPMNDTTAERAMLTAVAEEIQSFGINENEIKRVLRILGFERECSAIEEHERAYCLYEGARCIMEALGFQRIQIHNLGYYVVLLKKPYDVSPEHVRSACLYASSVNAIKAKYGGYVPFDRVQEAASIKLSDIGMEQVKGFAEEMRQAGWDIPADFEQEGIADLGDHYVLVVPAHVIPNPVSTVGMGDTISSSAYAYEWKPVCAQAK